MRPSGLARGGEGARSRCRNAQTIGSSPAHDTSLSVIYSFAPHFKLCGYSDVGGHLSTIIIAFDQSTGIVLRPCFYY